MAWNVQELQIAIFAPSATDVSATACYEALLGEECITSQTNKFARPDKPFLAQASGQIGETEVTVQTQDGRLDIFFRARSSQNFPTLLPFLDAETFMEKVLSNFEFLSKATPDCYRQAIVINDGVEFKNERKAIDAFCEYTGLGIDRSGLIATDLNLQFNSRISLESGAQINRLKRIGVDVMSLYQAPPPFFLVGQTDMHQKPIKQSFILNTVSDYNSVPTGVISSSQQRVRFSEMFGMMKEAEANG
ncbi:hypothetical protein LX81_00299 [Palleronia aestuarii]|uniref:Uncharacterized protein n=1 Tax=Palleronia aestuarii TaxID=568105 RepID=A0A2W7P334_9RHOB|nr:hypothetical protein [Palleronia aestuarii]PZX19836.1 hypothetical protein LX81_00299 [Palleronia aestuarii]